MVDPQERSRRSPTRRRTPRRSPIWCPASVNGVPCATGIEHSSERATACCDTILTASAKRATARAWAPETCIAGLRPAAQPAHRLHRLRLDCGVRRREQYRSLSPALHHLRRCATQRVCDGARGVLDHRRRLPLNGFARHWVVQRRRARPSPIRQTNFMCRAQPQACTPGERSFRRNRDNNATGPSTARPEPHRLQSGCSASRLAWRRWHRRHQPPDRLHPARTSNGSQIPTTSPRL